MLDLIYKTLQVIIKKEKQGDVTGTEFNLLANNVQNEIFRNYFEEESLDKLKIMLGRTSSGYSELSFIQRQRIQQFASVAVIALDTTKFNLPSDLYLLEDDGVSTSAGQAVPNKVIEEIERGKLVYLENSIAKPTTLYPVYELYKGYMIVSPIAVDEIKVRYLSKPTQPNWTSTLVNGQPMFNPADVSYNDFDLHPSEFSNIVLRMLTYFGINLREADVVKVAELLKDKMNQKDNG